MRTAISAIAKRFVPLSLSPFSCYSKSFNGKILEVPLATLVWTCPKNFELSVPRNDTQEKKRNNEKFFKNFKL